MEFLESLDIARLERQHGVAVVVFPSGAFEANSFLRFLLLVRRLPARLVLVCPHAELAAHIPLAQQAQAKALGHGVHLVEMRYGFDDEPDIPLALADLEPLQPDPLSARYYVIEEPAADAPVTGMSRWRRVLFRLLSAANAPAADSFHLPPERTTNVSPSLAGADAHELRAAALRFANDGRGHRPSPN